MTTDDTDTPLVVDTAPRDTAFHTVLEARP